jgi:IS5 family transposase
MKQLSFSDAEYGGKRKRTRREVFLAEDAPGGAMVAAGGTDRAALSEGRRRSSAVSLGDDAADPLPAAVVRAERPGDGGGTLRDRLDAAVRGIVAGPWHGAGRDDDPKLPSSAGATWLGARDLRHGEDAPAGGGPVAAAGHATIISAPSSTKNSTGERDPEMHQTKKGNQWYFGHEGPCRGRCRERPGAQRIGTAASVADVTQARELLHGHETVAFGDAGYIGAGPSADSGSSGMWR